MAGFLKVNSNVKCTKETQKKSHVQSTPTKMKDYTNNTLTGCISTEPRQTDITKNRPHIKINSYITTKTNKRTI